MNLFAFDLVLLLDINLESIAEFSILTEHPRSIACFNIHLPVPLSSALSSILSKR